MQSTSRASSHVLHLGILCTKRDTLHRICRKDTVLNGIIWIENNRSKWDIDQLWVYCYRVQKHLSSRAFTPSPALFPIKWVV